MSEIPTHIVVKLGEKQVIVAKQQIGSLTYDRIAVCESYASATLLASALNGAKRKQHAKLKEPEKRRLPKPWRAPPKPARARAIRAAKQVKKSVDDHG